MINIFKNISYILIFLSVIVLLLPVTPYITHFLNLHLNPSQQSLQSLNKDKVDRVNVQDSEDEGEMVLHIPAIGLKTKIEITNENSLYEPWKVKYSSFPDQEGNLVLAGHSYTYANPFNPTFFFLDQLSIQDSIEVLWQERVYKYEVYDVSVVKPSDTAVEKKSFHSEITLYTCYPKYIGNKRLIIKGKLVSIE